jgi:aspartate racemase
MQGSKTIGVVGGMGPYAGLELVKKIFDNTLAIRDQDHLSVSLSSFPSLIPDRTGFLQGFTAVNPAEAISEILLDLEENGAQVAGIPCNTSHSPAIFSALTARLRKAGSRLKVLHMIQEAAAFAREAIPGVTRLGVLCTTGAYRAGIFPAGFEGSPITIVLPDEKTQTSLVHPAIYDPGYGIKAHSNPVTEEARARLLEAISNLEKAGAEGIILGCTEIPLAFPGPLAGGMPNVDPALALARALIREAAPEKLRPWKRG